MIRVAFLGCGAVARAHARRLRRHRRDVTVGFASREPARAEAYARELGGRAWPSYEAAIEAADVDVVAVVTPPASHLPLTLAALGAGKHVLVEKPPFPRAADFDAVEAAAARAGRHVFVAENYFYKPSLARLRRVLAEGAIGDVLFVHVNAIKRQVADDWRGEHGALFEGGIHWMSFMNNLGLTVRAVRGFAPARPAGASERSMMVAFEYAEGAVGQLSYSWEVPATAKGLRLSKIYGRAGTVTFESNGLWVLLHGKKTRLYVPGLRDLAGYRRMFEDFVRAWKEGTGPELTLARARRDLELVEAAYATAGIGGQETT